MHTHIHTDKYAGTHARARARAHTHTHIYIYIYIYIYIGTQTVAYEFNITTIFYNVYKQKICLITNISISSAGNSNKFALGQIY